MYAKRKRSSNCGDISNAKNYITTNIIFILSSLLKTYWWIFHINNYFYNDQLKKWKKKCYRIATDSLFICTFILYIPYIFGTWLKKNLLHLLLKLSRLNYGRFIDSDEWLFYNNWFLQDHFLSSPLKKKTHIHCLYVKISFKHHFFKLNSQIQ